MEQGQPKSVKKDVSKKGKGSRPALIREHSDDSIDTDELDDPTGVMERNHKMKRSKLLRFRSSQEDMSIQETKPPNNAKSTFTANPN